MPPPALIAELKRLHAESTQGDWRATRTVNQHALGNEEVWDVECEDGDATTHVADCGSTKYPEPAANAAFSAAAHNHLPSLIAALESAEADNAKLRKQVEELQAAKGTAKP